jgi:transcriptional regulator with XRE-family HTH domain
VYLRSPGLSQALPSSLQLAGGYSRIVGSCPIATPERALSDWHKVNPPDTVYDPERFRREILPRLASVKLSEISSAAGCSKASASDYQRGKRTPHVSTRAALASWAGSSFKTPLGTNKATSHSPPDQPRIRPPLPQGDR